MEELLYYPKDIANIIYKYDLTEERTHQFISFIWNNEKEYLPFKYKEDFKSYFLDVMDQINFLVDSTTYNQEIPLINRDLKELGSDSEINEDDYYVELYTFFKEIRLRILYLDKNDYVRMKLRTMLREHGYKKRTPMLMNHFYNCLYFYHIETYTKGNNRCNIYEIKLDDMLIFRVLGHSL